MAQTPNVPGRQAAAARVQRTILNAPVKMTTSGKGPEQALARGKVLAGVCPVAEPLNTGGPSDYHQQRVDRFACPTICETCQSGGE
jgi:hypothetical protein